MSHFIKKALSDIRLNRFLNLATIFTISLSILVVSVFMLFFENAGRVVQAWSQGGRAMVYLKGNFTKDMMPEVKEKLENLGNIQEIVFISKDDALDRLKKEISQSSTFLKTLQGNPLPDTFEIRMKSYSNIEEVEAFAKKIKEIEIVEDVEYGQGWLDKFLKIFNLFKITGYAMCGLFFLVALFITSNTVRLSFYSRKIEIEVMRLVGATENFIKAPFYVEGLLQGFLGGALGIAILLIAYLMISSGITQSLSSYMYIDIHFLSLKTIILIIFVSTFLGWFGCYLSLKQILK